jgi:hypothetical protein
MEKDGALIRMMKSPTKILSVAVTTLGSESFRPLT